jgi:glutamate/tyrosine decarboxylase-like PLP-dependent enzyme
MRDLLLDAAERAARYREALARRSVVPTAAALQRLALFNERLPNQPTDPQEVLRLLDEIGSPATVASAGGRYYGFVTGSSLPATVAANWLAGAWDQNAGMEVATPIGAALESVCARWLIELFSLPATTGVGFVTGATMANFTGLAAARHALLQREGWDVEQQGLFEAPPIHVIVGDEVHVSVLKALSLLGLGRGRVQRVPTDDQGRMRPELIPRYSGPTIICGQVGHVGTGACDPILEICATAREIDAWVHVDGAFGLWAAAAPQRAHLVHGLSEVDSWATDAHKWLNVPYDCGLAFVREEEQLRAAMSISAAYLTASEGLAPSEGRQPDQYVPELSRRARGVEVWAALKSLGREGLSDLIERCCQHAAYFANGLRRAGYEVLNEVVLNQVLVSFGSDDVTHRVITALQREGTCWCGGTTHRGRAAMRISVSSWVTTAEDCERSLAAMLAAAADAVAARQQHPSAV